MSITPPSFEERVLQGFAGLAVANPRATVALAYDPSGDLYPEGVVGIYLDRWPEVPGGTITLADYTVEDHMSLSDSVIGVQVTIRHRDLGAVKAISADLFDLFHGHAAGMLGSVTLVSARRASGTNAGQDANERQGRIENYYLTVHRPSLNRS